MAFPKDNHNIFKLCCFKWLLIGKFVHYKEICRIAGYNKSAFYYRINSNSEALTQQYHKQVEDNKKAKAESKQTMITKHLKDNFYISDEELCKYIPLVDIIAKRLAKAIHQFVDLQELVEEGLIGLVDARNRYGTSYNSSFKNYAEFRIRGAMMDYIRKNGLLSIGNINKDGLRS